MNSDCAAKTYERKKICCHIQFINQNDPSLARLRACEGQRVELSPFVPLFREFDALN